MNSRRQGKMVACFSTESRTSSMLSRVLWPTSDNFVNFRFNSACSFLCFLKKFSKSWWTLCTSYATSSICDLVLFSIFSNIMLIFWFWNSRSFSLFKSWQWHLCNSHLQHLISWSCDNLKSWSDVSMLKPGFKRSDKLRLAKLFSYTAFSSTEFAFDWFFDECCLIAASCFWGLSIGSSTSFASLESIWPVLDASYSTASGASVLAGAAPIVMKDSSAKLRFPFSASSTLRLALSFNWTMIY